MQLSLKEKAAHLKPNWLSNVQFWTCTLFLLHLCVCTSNHSHMCTHSCTVHNINTFSAHDAQTQQCCLHFHRNWILANEKGCKHFYCCHGNMNSVHMPSIANINTSRILWHSQCGAIGGKGMLQQILGCRGCGRERVRWLFANLGEVIWGQDFCSCLGFCCTLELGDKATRARQTVEKQLTSKSLNCCCCF